MSAGQSLKSGLRQQCGSYRYLCIVFHTLLHRHHLLNCIASQKYNFAPIIEISFKPEKTGNKKYLLKAVLGGLMGCRAVVTVGGIFDITDY